MANEKNLAEALSNLRQKPLAKMGNRVVIRMKTTANIAKSHRVVGGGFKFTRTEGSGELPEKK